MEHVDSIIVAQQGPETCKPTIHVYIYIYIYMVGASVALMNMHDCRESETKNSGIPLREPNHDEPGTMSVFV